MTLNPNNNVDKGKGKVVMNLINHDNVEKSINESLTYYALVAREAELETKSQISGHIRLILKEFSEVLPKDLSGELPPMRDIQDAID